MCKTASFVHTREKLHVHTYAHTNVHGFPRVWTKLAHFYYTCAYKCAFIFDRLWIATIETKHATETNCLYVQSSRHYILDDIKVFFKPYIIIYNRFNIGKYPWCI